MDFHDLEKDEKENFANSIRFLDGVSKSLDGLREKFTSLLNEVEARNDKQNELLKVTEIIKKELGRAVTGHFEGEVPRNF